jgi:hypothetical protein
MELGSAIFFLYYKLRYRYLNFTLCQAGLTQAQQAQAFFNIVISREIKYDLS